MDRFETLTMTCLDVLRTFVRSELWGSEGFYYVSLNMTQDGVGPSVLGWTVEAWERYQDEHHADLDPSDKWWWALAPYYLGGDDAAKLQTLVGGWEDCLSYTDEGWDAELAARADAMAAGVTLADAEGLFGYGVDRERLLVTVEFIPHDRVSADLVRALNSGPLVSEWLRAVGSHLSCPDGYEP